MERLKALGGFYFISKYQTRIPILSAMKFSQWFYTGCPKVTISTSNTSGSNKE